MALDLIVATLQKQPLFDGLSALQLREIARKVDRIVYTPGSTIVEENAQIEAAILIVTGEAARVSGPQLTGQSEPVSPGSLLCESGMLVETHCGSTIVARTEVRTLHITREGLRELMLADSTIADLLVANLAHRLTQLAVELRRVDEILSGGEVSAAAISKEAGAPALPAPTQ